MIINEICNILNIKKEQVVNTLKLLEEGATVPFIARYRKETTGALNEDEIRKINEYYEYQVNLFKRKEDVIRLIDEKGLLTEELKNSILNASKLVEVEDLYRPYKEKKKTKATDAINNGLEGLAKIIMSFPTKGNIDEITKKYLNDKVKTKEEAILGASYIIAEWVSDNAYYRKSTRNYIYNNGIIVCKVKKNANDPNKVYEMYYNYSEKINNIKSHRILAINRAEKENVINVNIECDDEKIINFLYSKIIRKESYVESIIKNAINDSYKRLIKPAIEREIRSDLTDKASSDAIDSFGLNLEKLLLTPPLKEKWVMGLDPAFRTGCKLAVIDPTGKMVEIAKIYPHEPVKKYEEAKMQVKALLDKYKIEIIAIGNGTASRESEAFIADTIKDYKNVNYIIVSEAGASVYSASPLAKSEFPDLQVEERSAVSIGRRLQDPLAELVKINPESIGVGLYQHDLPNKKLSETLDFTVSKAVNMVGVNINTASPYLLKYISGLNKSSIEKIIKYRENKRFESREELLDKKILSPKVYEQAIGFLRVNGSNILDETSIHPESYPLALKLLEELNLNINDIGTDKMNININIDEMSKKLNTDTFTLEDIILSLKKPKRDPRDEAKKPILRHDILDIKDLKIGDTLNGTVRNVTPFGAFVDIGLHDDGLIHISKMSKDFVKDPGDILSVGEIIEVYVDSIDLAKKRIGLSLIK
ncbi:MAG: RNA-binding transcriptional accessory protein [Firmicutes bacterium]|nr:RNA-binding transcriptional accessory protein [Bacillota bacterium]